MVTAKDLKKSRFVEVLSAEQTDRFDFTRGAQNLAISFQNLVASLGASGVLQSMGEITAMPVLYQNAGVNFIRAILGGSGIAASLSPQNGILLDHNFIVDNGGVALMINEGSSSPIFRSIIGGTGINVSGSGSTIQIANSAVPASTKTIVVYSIDDFPAPVAGVITLAGDTEYKLENDISSANRFVMGDTTVLSGADGTLIELEYTGIGAMITAADKNFKIKDIVLRCDTGTLFAVSSTTGTHVFRFYTSLVFCANIGNFDGMNIVFITTVTFNASGNGISFSNNNNILLLDTISLNIPSGTGNGITLGSATFDSVSICKVAFNISTTGYQLSGLANSGNINAGGLGVIVDTRNEGTSTFSDNISPYDNFWEAQVNSDIINSFDLCLATHGASTVAIAAAATPVIVGATWTQQDAHRFTTTAGGRFTYNGKGTHVEISASISGDIAVASDNISFFVYRNGVQITNSRAQRLFVAGNVGNIALIWDIELNTGDYIEIWVQNDDTDVDVNIEKITLRIRS